MGERHQQGETAFQRKTAVHERIHRIPRLLEDFDKPYIVAINGVATGAGLDMALMGDIRFAAESARMAETYIRVGLIAGDGGTWFLPRLVGIAEGARAAVDRRFRRRRRGRAHRPRQQGPCPTTS